jgi:hypothetical protein
MPERDFQHQEKFQTIDRSISAINVADLARLGDPDRILAGIGMQVSSQIAQYNSGHPGEMLPKTPESIVDQFVSGRSFVILTSSENPSVLFHATIYQNFDEREQEALGFQVVELGSVITNPDFRGMGLGSRGCRKVVEHVRELNHNTICLSTVKQELTARVLSQAGMYPASFWEHPYLSCLTCTCTDCSESYGFTSCPFRRSISQSSPELLQILTDKSQPLEKIPCSLFISDPGLAAGFESRCRDLNQRLSGVSLPSGGISLASMTQAADFFAKVGKYD